jgi:hypothetical protein
MTYDTTIPGMSAETVPSAGSGQATGDGVVVVVGRFEKGDGNTPYFIKSPGQAKDVLGIDADYPGYGVIEMLFKKDTANQSDGASSVIAIKAGASVGASTDVIDTTPETPVVIGTITALGGVWGNSLKLTVAAGTTTGNKFTIKNGTVTVYEWDNLTPTQLMAKINSTPDLIFTENDLTKTPKVVADQVFEDGTEEADPTYSDLLTALEAIDEEDFDHIVFTDVLDDAGYAVIKAYQLARLNTAKPTGATICSDDTKTESQKITLAAAIDNPYMNLLPETYTLIGGQELTEAETAALYAGFLVGLAPNVSPTNKLLSNVVGVSSSYNAESRYNLTKAGYTCLKLANRQQGTYKVVSAVTASKAEDAYGNITAWGEQHGVQSLIYVMNRLREIQSRIGSTGYSDSKEAVDGDIENLKDKLIPDVIADLNVPTSYDETNHAVLIGDVDLKVKGILKWIHLNVAMSFGGE